MAIIYRAGKGPDTYCEPKMTTVGSQDTTGPMTRDEMKDLACPGFSADLVMQSFCHTSAYPKSVDVKTHRGLPAFMSNRGGVSCARVMASSTAQFNRRQARQFGFGQC